METVCFLLFPGQVLKTLCNGAQSSSDGETLLKFSENLIFSKFVTYFKKLKWLDSNVTVFFGLSEKVSEMCPEVDSPFLTCQLRSFFVTGTRIEPLAIISALQPWALSVPCICSKL